MNEAYIIPLMTGASGLVGALIGALASIITIWVQSNIHDRRERLRHAADLALEDYKIQLDLADKSGQYVELQPIVLYLHYHLRLIELMEKGKLTPKTLREVTDDNVKIKNVIVELNKERESERADQKKP